MDYVVLNGKILHLEENGSQNGESEKTVETSAMERLLAYRENLSAISDGRDHNDDI